MGPANMVTAPLSPTMSTTSSTRTRRESRDTGFPEPFCGERNTTWHHPEADTSPGASLCSEDINQEPIYQQPLRRSIFKKSRRTVSHGKIVVESQFQGLALALADPPQTPQSSDGSEEGAEEDGKVHASKDSTDSLQLHEPPSPTSSSLKRRRYLFRKMWYGGSK